MMAALPFDISVAGLVLFTLLGLLVFVALQGLRVVVLHLPMSKASRERTSRLLPLGEALVALVYVLSAVPMVFGTGTWTAIGLALVLLGVVWVSWFAIRDYISGLVIRAGRICRVGDALKLDDLSGRVTALGARTMVVQTVAGEEAVIPYSQVTSRAIVRTPEADGAHRHSFAVQLPAAPERAADVVASLRRSALLHHWSSLVHEPLVERLGDGRYEVTVFSLTPEHAPAIEATVRASLGVEPRHVPPTESDFPR